jgi:hypothetical protein
MVIRISKGRHGPVLTCTRDDGTVTGARPSHGAFLVRHDLMHDYVETELEFRRAFFGQVAAGRSIESFSAPGSGRGLPNEAMHAEFIIGRLDQVVLWETAVVADRFNAEVQAAAAQGGAEPPPRLTRAQLDSIIERFHDVYTRYQVPPVGGHLELTFPVEHPPLRAHA